VWLASQQESFAAQFKRKKYEIFFHPENPFHRAILAPETHYYRQQEWAGHSASW
jgi:hypothetical protein